jgi:sigma-B regulation protein RsbU (phosphoserine phosphatase)
MSPSRARILVVDDDPGVLRAVRRVLAPDHELASTSSPTEALSLVERFRPDLAILDVRMPEMDGFELMARLKAAQPDVDVIFVTGSLTDPDARLIRAIRQGAFYFLQKPFDRDVLRTLVERCLELRHLRAVAERELTKLHTAQSRLLPQAAPEVAGYNVTFRYRPFYFATGDYYDFFLRPNGELAAFLGDSAGHGPSASMLMASMRAILRTRNDIHGDPSDTLAKLTSLLTTLIPDDLFMTAVYIVLSAGGKVRWSAAGQHPPLRVTIDGKVQDVELSALGLPLGVLPDERYRTVTWEMAPGERLVLFTDGIIEAMDHKGKLFGTEGVRRSLESLSRGPQSLDETVDGLVELVKQHLEGSEFEDDFTVLAIERRQEA